MGKWASTRQEAESSPDYDNLRHYLHDLAQPLGTVTGLVDLMLLELDERDKMFREVQLISQQLDKVMQIVGEIRRVTREAADRCQKNLETAPDAAVLMAALPAKYFFRASTWAISQHPRPQPAIIPLQLSPRLPARWPLSLANPAKTSYHDIEK